MECFIVKGGVEQKAELEDILPLLEDRRIQNIFLNADYYYFHLPFALAYMADEMKEMIYRNILIRVRKKLEKEVSEAESRYEKDSDSLKENRTNLLSFIGEYAKKHSYKFPEYIVWKDDVQKDEMPIKESSNHIEELIKVIEEACNSGHLEISSYYTYKMTIDVIYKAFAAFKDRKNELQKVKKLEIQGKDLPGAALLFEIGVLEELKIDNEFTGSWPSFMEKCHSLKSIELGLWNASAEFPPWIHNVVSLQYLSIWGSGLTTIPDWIGDLQSITELSIDYNHGNLKTLSNSLSNLKNLSKLHIRCSGIDKLPDNICELASLKELSLESNKNLVSLPNSIANLMNLEKFTLSYSPIERLPDWICDLDSLAELSLKNDKNLKFIPDSIGKLKNLVKLDLSGIPIENLPETIVNCNSLEYLDIRRTNINSVPNFISRVKTIKQSIELIPEEHSISYRSFCNCYYRLVETIIQFANKARNGGLLALEDCLENLSDDIFHKGMRLVVDGNDNEIIRHLLLLEVEREHDHYKKKLKEIAMEGALSIQAGDNPRVAILRLTSMVAIKDNPLDAACAKYLAGDDEAFDNIDLKAAIQPEEEREEIRFIRRVMTLSKVSREEGILALEKHLDHEGIKARDVLEYGLPLIIDNWDYEQIDKILSALIAHEINPVRKNLALAKKDAVRMIFSGYNPSMIIEILSNYFDDGVTMGLLTEDIYGMFYC